MDAKGMEMDSLMGPRPDAASGILHYVFIALAIIVPVIWKLYTSSPPFRYQMKMVFYMTWVFLTSFLIIPFALRDPRNPDNTRTIGRWIFVDLLRVKDLFGIEVETRHAENFKIKGDGPFVAVTNHQSSLDLIPLFDAVPPRCTGLGKKSLLYTGPFALAAWLCGAIFVDRRPGKSRGTMDQAAEEMVEKNKRIWMFPEGTRNHGGGLLPFKKGAFHLALQCKGPVIPVVVSSYSSFYDKKTSKFESGKMIVTVLPPISTDNYTAENINELVEKTRNQMLDVFKTTSKEVNPDFEMTDLDEKKNKK